MRAAHTATVPGDFEAAEYEVISPLNHDAREYGSGETIVLTAQHAAPLLGHTIRLAPVLSGREEVAARADSIRNRG